MCKRCVGAATQDQHKINTLHCYPSTITMWYKSQLNRDPQHCHSAYGSKYNVQSSGSQHTAVPAAQMWRIDRTLTARITPPPPPPPVKTVIM